MRVLSERDIVRVVHNVILAEHSLAFNCDSLVGSLFPNVLISLLQLYFNFKLDIVGESFFVLKFFFKELKMTQSQHFLKTRVIDGTVYK